MQRGELLYTGKAKSVYECERDDAVIIHYRDDASAFDGVKKAQLAKKGLVNNQFNAYIMRQLEKAGVKTHFIDTLSDDESMVKKLTMLPVECVVRNHASGSICKRLGLEDGVRLEPATFEFFLKDDALHDPMINESHIETFAWATAAEVNIMKERTFKVNEVLSNMFAEGGMILVDFKLEFGRFGDELILGDEFSPDGCRIWDAETGKKLDKDRFRQDLGDVIESYLEVARRLDIPISV